MRNLNLLCVILSLFFLISCQRSKAFLEQEKYYDPGAPYAEGGALGNENATSRLERVGQPKKRVLILDFVNQTPIKDADFGGFISTELKRLLFTSRRVIVPEEIQTQMKTEDILSGDKIKVAQLIREARRLGVSVAVVGRIAKITVRQKGDEAGFFRQRRSSAAADVEIKVFDVHTGREILSTGRSGQANQSSLLNHGEQDLERMNQARDELVQMSLRETANLLVPDVLKSLDRQVWSAEIIRVTPNKIYINAGHRSGLLVGDILRVMSRGQDLYHPETGAYLGRELGQLKGTLEVVNFIGPDGAVSEVHSGGNFREGDSVQLY